MLDLLLITAIGFFGSFGHCVGMCGPLTVAFALSSSNSLENSHAKDLEPEDLGSQDPQSTPGQTWQQLRFHGLLNLGRILSYACLGALIGGLGSVLVAGGQMAGLGSILRRTIAVITGVMLVWYGLWQLDPKSLPRLPFLNPILNGGIHNRLNSAMNRLSQRDRWWTPALLGAVWGLIPCGFLYTAQIKAAETSSAWMGALIMLAFGAGTIPAMVSMGTLASRFSRDRRSQLHRMGGWLTLAVGLLTLFRTGDNMADYAGHSAIALLLLTLIARPIAAWWPALLTYRRALGVGSFVLSAIHILHALEHSWGWNLEAVAFMIPSHQVAIWLGVAATTCMLPAALTSFDLAQKKLGKTWRTIHLLAVPAMVFAALHAIAIGPRFLGTTPLNGSNWLLTGMLALSVLGVFVLRSRRWTGRTSKKRGALEGHG